jgi:hypothetical protein
MLGRTGALFLGLALLPSPVGADTCPSYFTATPKVSYEDTADGGATRIVRDYDGHRVFQLQINEPVAGQVVGSDGSTYRLQVSLNGRTAIIDGTEFCTTVSAAAYGNQCDWKNEGSAVGGLAADLFFYAAYEDHLNAWDVVVHAVKADGSINPAATRFHFAQKKFSDLTWE